MLGAVKAVAASVPGAIRAVPSVLFNAAKMLFGLASFALWAAASVFVVVCAQVFFTQAITLVIAGQVGLAAVAVVPAVLCLLAVVPLFNQFLRLTGIADRARRLAANSDELSSMENQDFDGKKEFERTHDLKGQFFGKPKFPAKSITASSDEAAELENQNPVFTLYDPFNLSFFSARYTIIPRKLFLVPQYIKYGLNWLMSRSGLEGYAASIETAATRAAAAERMEAMREFEAEEQDPVRGRMREIKDILPNILASRNNQIIATNKRINQFLRDFAKESTVEPVKLTNFLNKHNIIELYTEYLKNNHAELLDKDKEWQDAKLDYAMAASALYEAYEITQWPFVKRIMYRSAYNDALKNVDALLDVYKLKSKEFQEVNMHFKNIWLKTTNEWVNTGAPVYNNAGLTWTKGIYNDFVKYFKSKYNDFHVDDGNGVDKVLCDDMDFVLEIFKLKDSTWITDLESKPLDELQKEFTTIQASSSHNINKYLQHIEKKSKTIESVASYLKSIQQSKAATIEAMKKSAFESLGIPVLQEQLNAKVTEYNNMAISIQSSTDETMVLNYRNMISTLTSLFKEVISKMQDIPLYFHKEFSKGYAEYLQQPKPTYVAVEQTFDQLIDIEFRKKEQLEKQSLSRMNTDVMNHGSVLPETTKKIKESDMTHLFDLVRNSNHAPSLLQRASVCDTLAREEEVQRPEHGTQQTQLHKF